MYFILCISFHWKVREYLWYSEKSYLLCRVHTPPAPVSSSPSSSSSLSHFLRHCRSMTISRFTREGEGGRVRFGGAENIIWSITISIKRLKKKNSSSTKSWPSVRLLESLKYLAGPLRSGFKAVHLWKKSNFLCIFVLSGFDLILVF